MTAFRPRLTAVERSRALAALRSPGRALVVTFSTPYMYDMGTFAVNRAKVMTMSVWGVMGYAATTSGLIWRIA